MTIKYSKCKCEIDKCKHWSTGWEDCEIDEAYYENGIDLSDDSCFKASYNGKKCKKYKKIKEREIHHKLDQT